MDYLTFFTKLIESLAWPIAAAIIVVSLRTQIITMLGNIKKIKAGSIEAEFQKLEQEVKNVKEKTEAVSTKFDEVDDSGDQQNYTGELSDPERQVLKSIITSRFVMRSLDGVAKDTGLPKNTVNEIYSDLIKKGLLVQTTNTDGKLRWFPTNLGRSAASDIS